MRYLLLLLPVIALAAAPVIWNGPTARFLAPVDSPVLLGTPTAPTASLGTNTTQVATTAFVMGQGFLGATGSMPSANAVSSSMVTSATTTYVTAMSTTITVTAASAPVYARASADIKATTAAAVGKYRVSINGVAGQEQQLSLLNAVDHYTASSQAISSALPPGTYTVIFEIGRVSGTGTVNFFQGTLSAMALQGASSNGITQLTGSVTAGPGSGSQVATIAAGAITNAMVSPSAALAFSKLAALPSGNVLVGSAGGAATSVALSGDASISNTGVLTVGSGAITNAKIASVDALKLTTGTLPFARGGTGTTTFANQRIPFSNGTNLLSDANFIYDTVNGRLNVGGSGTARGNFITSSGSTVPLQAYNQGTNNAFQVFNQAAYTISMTSRQNTALAGASIGMEFGRGTLVAPLQALSGDILGTIVANGYTGTQTAPGFAGSINFVAAEDVTNTANGGDIIIATTPITTLAPLERLRITNDGLAKFKMGTVLDTSAAQPPCDAAHRGLLWVIRGGAGFADILQICLKDASDVYGWVIK